MNLCVGAVANGNHGSHRPAIIGHRNLKRRIAANQRKAKHEIGVIARYKPFETPVRARGKPEPIRTYLRQAQPQGGHLGDIARDPAKAGSDAMFQSVLGHQLHAHADAQKQFALPCCCFECLEHS